LRVSCFLHAKLAGIPRTRNNTGYPIYIYTAEIIAQLYPDVQQKTGDKMVFRRINCRRLVKLLKHGLPAAVSSQTDPAGGRRLLQRLREQNMSKNGLFLRLPTHLNPFLNFPPLFLKGFSGMMTVERGKEKKLCIAFWSVTTNGTS
jgi:hypothetical protein